MTTTGLFTSRARLSRYVHHETNKVIKDLTVTHSVFLTTTQLIGTAGELPKAPVQQTKFLEDMDDNELAQAVGPMLDGLHLASGSPTGMC